MSRVDLDPIFRRTLANKRRPAQVSDLVDGFAVRKAMGDLADLPLAVAVHQHVGLGIEQDGAPHLLGPVIKMGDAAQGSFDAADDDRHILERFACALRIDNDGAIRTLAAFAAGGIGVVATHPPIGGVAVNHRIHVSGGNAEEQVRTAKLGESRGAVPIGLGDHAHPEAVGLQHSAHYGHAKAWVVHVGVAGDHNDVAGIPAQRIHFRTGHGQKRGGTEALGPVLAVTRDVACGLHEGADYLPKASASPGTFVAPTGTFKLEPSRSAPVGSNRPPRHWDRKPSATA